MQLLKYTVLRRNVNVLSSLILWLWPVGVDTVVPSPMPLPPKPSPGDYPKPSAQNPFPDDLPTPMTPAPPVDASASTPDLGCDDNPEDPIPSSTPADVA